jgi:hypothetical protein
LRQYNRRFTIVSFRGETSAFAEKTVQKTTIFGCLFLPPGANRANSARSRTGGCMAQRGRKAAVCLVEPAVLRPRPGGHLGSTPAEPPEHLGQPEQSIWHHAFEFEISNGLAVDVLVCALEAHMRARQAREAIAREGMTVTGPAGQPRPHPLLQAEKEGRAQFLAGIKVLGLKL